MSNQRNRSLGALGAPPPMTIPGYGYPAGENKDQPPGNWRYSFVGAPVESKAACGQQGGAVYFGGTKCCFWSEDKNEYRCNRIYSTSEDETPAQTSDFYSGASSLTAQQYARPGAYPGQYPQTYPGQYPSGYPGGGYPGQYASIGGIDTSTLLIGGAVILAAYLALK